jgi:endonuclease-3 related protein
VIAAKAKGVRVSSSKERRIRAAFVKMLDAYGPQGWWPVECERERFSGSPGPRSSEGYHPSEFDFPRTAEGRFEICCGAVLTQNTAWTNVRKALQQLRSAVALRPRAVLDMDADRLSALIRPAGYFNQKSRYLCAVAAWFEANDVEIAEGSLDEGLLERVRPQLLAVRGVGPETADSILLYAYRLPTFVVDAYTRRVLGRLGVVDENWAYERIRALCTASLRRESIAATVESFQEMHALIVEHAKRHHVRQSDPALDFLRRAR